IQRVEVRRPRISLRRNGDGKWNFDALIPRRPDGLPVPPIVISKGEAVLVDQIAPDAQPIVLRDADITIAPVAQAAAPGGWPSLDIDGTASGAHCKQLELHAKVDGPQQSCTGVVTLKGVLINDQL